MSPSSHPPGQVHPSIALVQPPLDRGSSGDVPNRADRELLVLISEGAEGDVHRNLDAVLAQRAEPEAQTHGASAGIRGVPLLTLEVVRSKALRDENIDRESDELVGAVPEDGFAPVVREDDQA